MGNREFASTPGHLWGLSVTTWTAGPIYNVDLLHKAGYNAPRATWADFLKLCSTLKDMKVTPIRRRPTASRHHLAGAYRRLLQ